MADVARVPLVTGLVLALLVGGLLATSPAAFVGKGATFIETSAWADEGGGQPVETTAYLRSTEDLRQLPEGFGEWNMTRDASDDPGWRNVKDTFQADALVSRHYAKPGLYVPIHTFIIDSQYTRVLHSLPVSYGLQGFEEQRSGTAHINVSNASWLAEDSPNDRIPVVQGTYVDTNATTGEVEERRLVQYYWVKRQAWGVTNHLTWVGADMRVPTEGNISDHRALLSNFTADLTAQLFVPEASDVESTVAQALVKDRPLGPFLLAGGVLVPVALVGYGLWGGPGSGSGATTPAPTSSSSTSASGSTGGSPASGSSEASTRSGSRSSGSTRGDPPPPDGGEG